MWNATCVSDAYQHVRWNPHNPAVQLSTLKQLEQDWEENNIVIVKLLLQRFPVFSAHSCEVECWNKLQLVLSRHTLVLSASSVQNQSQMISVGLCTLFPNAQFCLNNSVFSMRFLPYRPPKIQRETEMRGFICCYTKCIKNASSLYQNCQNRAESIFTAGRDRAESKQLHTQTLKMYTSTRRCP